MIGNKYSFLKNYTDTNKQTFYLVGIVGKNIINKIQDNNISMMSFLSELKKTILSYLIFF